MPQGSGDTRKPKPKIILILWLQCYWEHAQQNWKKFLTKSIHQEQGSWKDWCNFYLLMYSRAPCRLTQLPAQLHWKIQPHWKMIPSFIQPVNFLRAKSKK